MGFLGLYLLTGTLVFIVESEYSFWWSSWLRPNEHFIPVKADMSDLRLRFDECCRNVQASEKIASEGRAVYRCGMQLKDSAQTLFSRNFLIQYMKDANSMLNQLPVYSNLNTLYSGGNHQSYISPGIDYYKLQHTRRYRFKRLNSEVECDCPSCQVCFDMAVAFVAIESVKKEKSKVIWSLVLKKEWIFYFFALCFESN